MKFKAKIANNMCNEITSEELEWNSKQKTNLEWKNKIKVKHQNHKDDKSRCYPIRNVCMEITNMTINLM
jgi:hypothetical protein